ncbi:prokaryal membrane protein [Sulfolobus acidocaldarius SUSAZ]|nr:prokaryal membrane protein [Sulfolobus acidocaldarius SUSAZ]
MTVTNFILKRKWLIIAVWAVILILITPAVMNYTKYISYSTGQSLPSNSESAIVNKILNGTSYNNDTLIVVVKENPYTSYSANQSLSFQNSTLSKGIPYLSSVQSPFNDYINFLTAVLSGVYHNTTLAHQYSVKYVEQNGLKGAPSFITSRYVSPDNTTFLLFVTFNKSSGFILQNGETPSQQAYPVVKDIAQRYFSDNASLTGEGAIAYETQQITSKNAFAFGLVFIILAIAVGITLRSYKGSLVSLLFISITTLIGYFAIFLVGALVTNVDFVVNYTLTAVLVGVTTDYVVFILARFRQELREGREDRVALEIASSKGGRAVLISGLTVGISLLSFSLVPNFLSWGLVLFLAVVVSTALILTLLPSILSIIRKRVFTKGGLNTVTTENLEKSWFYRVSDLSVRRKYVVAIVILALAVPAFMFFLNLPTTYNFNAGLPSSLPSVKALSFIEGKFGANELYPIIVLMKVNSSSSLNSNNTALKNQIIVTAKEILSTPGITKVYGPYVNGQEITNNTNISAFVVDGSYLLFTAYTKYDPFSSNAIHTVNALREYHDLLVGGLTSSVIDQQTETAQNFTELEVLITLFVALIIGISFKSWKFPLISISGVLISITWATGLLYLISRFVLNQPLIYLIPVILFVILMSLGNDYTVFIISRVVEDIEEHGEKRGIQLAISRTGIVVTSLGLILAASLGALALIPIGFLEQLGIAFIISLVIDTFVIRTIYFPAMLSILKVKRKGETKKGRVVE